tara:strand:+ start:106 stop:525 length:420 start_codon:yes stop_codon:yes gene_type:complete
MSKASKKRPRDDIPSVPVGSPVWIVKSWKELPEDRHGQRIDIGVSYKDYCVDGVFATLEAANAEARRARDRLVEKYDEEHMYELQEEEEEGTDEDERADEEVKKVNDKEPFVYCRDLGWDGEDGDGGDLNVVVEKLNVR